MITPVGFLTPRTMRRLTSAAGNASDSSVEQLEELERDAVFKKYVPIKRKKARNVFIILGPRRFWFTSCHQAQIREN